MALWSGTAACSQPTAAVATPEVVAPDNPPLPARSGAVKFAVIGDSGQWSTNMRQLAERLAAQRNRFQFDFVIMLGDNNYGDGSPESFRLRFEEPYKPLLDVGVKFYAALGNHDQDIGEEWKYPLFNMQGRRYLTFEEKGGPLPGFASTSVRFFVVNTNSLDSDQLDWLDRSLAGSKADWKIVYMHHPVYTTGRYGLTSIVRRRALEPILIRNRVDAVFAGHEHVYERLVPQGGVMYFISGAAGAVRMGDVKPAGILAQGYDKDLSFMLVQIAGDTLYFQTMTRTGETVDSGHVKKGKTS
jgi:3',5'-cyclic AMP phosphodiesterase CpdA